MTHDDIRQLVDDLLSHVHRIAVIMIDFKTAKREHPELALGILLDELEPQFGELRVPIEDLLRQGAQHLPLADWCESLCRSSTKI